MIPFGRNRRECWYVLAFVAAQYKQAMQRSQLIFSSRGDPLHRRLIELFDAGGTDRPAYYDSSQCLDSLLGTQRMQRYQHRLYRPLGPSTWPTDSRGSGSNCCKAFKSISRIGAGLPRQRAPLISSPMHYTVLPTRESRIRP